MRWFPEDVPVQSRMIDSWRIPLHLVEKGSDRQRTLLFLHGNPTWSFLYRDLIGPLAKKGYHVMVPDLPGFGCSGKWTHPDAYTFERHVRAAEHLVHRKAGNQLFIVGHDWGGPIGVRLLLNHPDRVSGLVLINSGTFFDLPLPGWFRLIRNTRVAELFSGAMNGFVEAGLRMGCAQRQKLTVCVMRHYRRPFRYRENRAGIIAFPQMIPTSSDHRNWSMFRKQENRVGEMDVPVGIISGRKDPVLGPRYGRRMTRLFPRAKHEVVERGSHYLQEDQPQRLIQLIGSFLDSVINNSW